MKLQYKTGKDLVAANALLRLYIQDSQEKIGLNPDWPLLVLHTKDKCFPSGTTNITKILSSKTNTFLLKHMAPYIASSLVGPQSLMYLPTKE